MICPKNISFLKHFFMNTTFLNGFPHIFENRTKIYLKILLKERNKEERKEITEKKDMTISPSSIKEKCPYAEAQWFKRA